MSPSASARRNSSVTSEAPRRTRHFVSVARKSSSVTKPCARTSISPNNAAAAAAAAAAADAASTGSGSGSAGVSSSGASVAGGTCAANGRSTATAGECVLLDTGVVAVAAACGGGGGGATALGSSEGDRSVGGGAAAAAEKVAAAAAADAAASEGGCGATAMEDGGLSFQPHRQQNAAPFTGAGVPQLTQLDIVWLRGGGGGGAL